MFAYFLLKEKLFEQFLTRSFADFEQGVDLRF
jgi:hypothetical protein